MRILYIDNNILGREQDWHAITRLCQSTQQIRVAISDWHMVELASGSDRPQVLRRADFIDSLNPLWMHGYLPIQKWEVKRFTWEHYYRVAAEEFSVFAEHLSEVWSTYVGPRTVIGLNARKWVAIVTDLRDLNWDKVKIVDILSTLQSATPQQKKRMEEETFLRWVLPRVNDRDPHGNAITEVRKIEIGKHCFDKKVHSIRLVRRWRLRASCMRYGHGTPAVAKAIRHHRPVPWRPQSIVLQLLRHEGSLRTPLRDVRPKRASIPSHS